LAWSDPNVPMSNVNNVKCWVQDKFFYRLGLGLK
jgi:hypothetical protein